jgi:nucleotide-binding universal stress UspA family protein
MLRLGRVVVGVSGSPGSLRALRYAENLARFRGAALVPVIAWLPPDGERSGRRDPSRCLQQAWTTNAAERLHDALLAAWGDGPQDLVVQPQVERGPPGWVLVTLAGEAEDLLVLGTGRRGALSRMLCCRVSRYCAAHARCPVILIPPAELASDLRRGRTVWALRHRTLTPAQVLAQRRARSA